MKTRHLRALAVVAILVNGQTMAQSVSSPDQVTTVDFESKSVGRKLKYNIALPVNYAKSDDRYPVLYLLHGYSGNYTNWARNAAPRFAGAYDLIVVMPDAGNSWYANWAEGDDAQKNAWE